jgi:hypothetical protein
MTLERPKTGTRKFDENDMKQISEMLAKPSVPLGMDGRPVTSAKMASALSVKEKIERNREELLKIEQRLKKKEEKEKEDMNKKIKNLSSRDLRNPDVRNYLN